MKNTSPSFFMLPSYLPAVNFILFSKSALKRVWKKIFLETVENPFLFLPVVITTLKKKKRKIFASMEI